MLAAYAEGVSNAESDSGLLNQTSNTVVQELVQGARFADTASAEAVATRLAYQQAAWQFLAWRLLQEGVILAYANRSKFPEAPGSEGSAELTAMMIRLMNEALTGVSLDHVSNSWNISSHPDA